MSTKKTKVEHDLHELVGQVLNERLRVVQLSYVSPRQWLYEVEPPSVGKTRRALKVFGHAAGREPGSFYRLKTTCDRLKGLECSHLEAVYETGVLHDLTPYLVTEWEPHVSLYEHLRLLRRPMSWGEALPLLIEVCEGLQALHQRGVTHGDLRAQHVLLREPPRGALLIDFGVSVAFGAPPAPGLDKSLAYWAPERLTFAAATPATDLYSLGVLMFLCLAGRLPFIPEAASEEDPVDPAQRLSELHRSAPPPALARPDVPPAVVALVARLMSKEPSKRPPKVDAVLEVLRHPEGVALSVVSPPQGRAQEVARPAKPARAVPAAPAPHLELPSLLATPLPAGAAWVESAARVAHAERPAPSRTAPPRPMVALWVALTLGAIPLALSLARLLS